MNQHVPSNDFSETIPTGIDIVHGTHKQIIKLVINLDGNANWFYIYA